MQQHALNELIRRVQRNCDISDARYAGGLSLCSFLLLIRNFHKWESRVEPWREEDSSVVLQWIEAKESLWEDMAEESFESLPLEGREEDPFSLEAVNQVVRPHGLVYGAGHAGGLKPTFFLGYLDESAKIGGLTAYYLGRELARDMIGYPALRQGRRLYLRKECARFFWWDKIVEKLLAKKPAVMFALDEYGVKDVPGLKSSIDAVIEGQLQVMLHHEIGEALIHEFDRPFKELVAAFPLSRVERFVRTLKDVLADTHPEGTLPHIIGNGKKDSLGFYVAFQEGFSALLFPEIGEGFKEFMVKRNWTDVEVIRKRAYGRFLAMGAELAQLVGKIPVRGLEYVRERIEHRFIDPLLSCERACSPA